MTQMVTRCPTCATAFRVTSTQLESAKGAVRCGSCLHIFQAQDYLVKTAEDEKPSQSKSVAQEPAKTEAKIEPLKKVEPAIQAKPEPAVAQPKVIPQKPEQPKPKSLVPEQKPVQPKSDQQIEKKSTSSAPANPIVTQPPASKVATAVAAPRQAVATEKTVVKPVVIDKAKILADEDDILISDDMDHVQEKPSSYEFDGFIDLDMHPKQTVSLFEREIRYEPPRDNNDEEATDESWAEGLLDDDGEPLHQFKKSVIVSSAEANAALQSADNEKVTDRDATTKDTKYSGPIFSLVTDNANESDEKTDDPLLSEAFLAATRAPEPAASPPSHFAALFDPDNEADVDSEESEKSSKRPVKSSKMRAVDTSRAALLMNIMPAPVEFTARRMRKYQRKLWPILAVCMCLLLLFQVAYFKFDYFSRVEPYRTAYLFICPLVGCEVPALVDTSQILATNLVVRNHPDIANALIVDAILINNAPFEQPFPDLILSFSKLDETPVASRRFTPKDYIAGELAGKKYIPLGHPIHIRLEIADPGPEAVNYILATH